MKDGFIKVAAATPKIRVADPLYNADRIIEQMKEAEEKGVKILVFPELCVTGYTCNDLFLQEALLEGALEGLQKIIDYSCGKDMISYIGAPIEVNNKLYNCAVIIQNGQIVGIVPKSYIPNHGEFYEQRYFASGLDIGDTAFVQIQGLHMRDDFEDDDFDTDDDDECMVSFGKIVLDLNSSVKGLKVACELCEDLWVADTPGTLYARAGATIIVNLSASNDLVGKDSYRRDLVRMTSGRLACGYIYASAGDGESTQDIVFGGHNIIAENGTILAEQPLFENGITYAEIDIARLCHERRRITTFEYSYDIDDKLDVVDVDKLEITKTKLTRSFPAKPFVPANERERAKRCEQILSIQAMGLKKRLEHTGCKTAVIGVSGGLDSTLALLVAVRAFDALELDRSGIIAVTMPCFGTTDRTYNNACKLAKALGATLKEVNIKKSVMQHFEDIGQDPEKHDVTYENCQARERTQVLMDIANMMNGMVIGTGDLSELALGWATYNGDHMSMYGVNAGVPKTLVRHLVQYYADTCVLDECEDFDVNKKTGKGTKARKTDLTKNVREGALVRDVLLDVLDTPVSPELLPPTDGKISQETESIVGPYELHDFFLYYMLRWGYPKEKIRRIAYLTFAGDDEGSEASYDRATIDKWLDIFCRRFFTQQFKRSCLPDGPKVGSVAVSPRGDLRMPSDASFALWL
ncbi:NAD(+) synthase [Butyrivibrio sp. JL13D10]|uniref:NAD(+) synthase n=1 Tax=Butyrivibrio sp. JL13D10 TaxID=3236815 RepID=UPI0038B50C99